MSELRKDDPRFAALLLPDRTPTPLAGDALVIVDLSEPLAAAKQSFRDTPAEQSSAGNRSLTCSPPHSVLRQDARDNLYGAKPAAEGLKGRRIELSQATPGYRTARLGRLANR